MEYKSIKTVMSIAGSDSSGGAGIQADIKTIMANGCYASTVITSVTAQNTMGVSAIADVDTAVLRAQLDAVYSDIKPDAVKIGMVSDIATIDTVAEFLRKHKQNNVVLDPVMVSTSGSRLLKEPALVALMDRLIPCAAIITPNIYEAEILSGIKIVDADTMHKAAQKICARYGNKIAVLLKGGHSVNDANDLLCMPDYNGMIYRWIYGERIDNPNTHGTGCTLSSAIASYLAKGYSMYDSVCYAKAYISNTLWNGINLGAGSGPLNHGYGITSPEDGVRYKRNKEILRKSVRLYAVTDRRWLKTGETLLEAVERAIRGGTTFVQLREKNISDEEYTAIALTLKKALLDKEVPLVINDNVNVAIASGVDGVHLGQGDMSISEARRRLGPGRIIGATAHNVREAVEAQRQGADYLGVGAVFETGTKSDTTPLSYDELKSICDAVSIPVVAIGGITTDNIPKLAGSNISGVAVVSSIFSAGDIERQSAKLRLAVNNIVESECERTYGWFIPEGKKGAIFDMDGTILDSMRMWDTVGERYLLSVGKTAEPNLNDRIKQMTFKEAAGYIKSKYNTEDSIEEIIEQIHIIAGKSYMNTLELKPGAENFILGLKAEGIRCIVATATELSLSEPVLKRLGVYNYLEDVITCSMVRSGKEKPDIFYRSCELLGLEKESCVVYEDSLYAIKTATEAGFDCVGVYDASERKNWNEICGLTVGQVVMDDEGK